MLQAEAGAEVQTRKILRNCLSLTELIVWLGDETHKLEDLSKPNAQNSGCWCLCENRKPKRPSSSNPESLGF